MYIKICRSFYKYGIEIIVCKFFNAFPHYYCFYYYYLVGIACYTTRIIQSTVSPQNNNEKGFILGDFQKKSVT